MRDDAKNAASKTTPARHETLKFHFTPVDGPDPDADNPHAKRTTVVDDTIEALRDQFGEAVGETVVYAGERTVYVDKDQLLEVARHLRDELGFVYFVDCGGVDNFTEEGRFEMFYNLVNIQARKRLRLRVRIEEDDPHVPSVTPIWRAAGWNEREAYDMYGIRFDGHPDMRRMYMPEDFEYYPKRKEFPLLGIPGSLPLPPQTPQGGLTMDPFAAAHGSTPVKSYEEPKADEDDA